MSSPSKKSIALYSYIFFFFCYLFKHGFPRTVFDFLPFFLVFFVSLSLCVSLFSYNFVTNLEKDLIINLMFSVLLFAGDLLCLRLTSYPFWLKKGTWPPVYHLFPLCPRMPPSEIIWAILFDPDPCYSHPWSKN